MSGEICDYAKLFMANTVIVVIRRNFHQTSNLRQILQILICHTVGFRKCITILHIAN